ncbi:hypothetical protein [Bullifex porci]|uniref:hypothetical protein n=1 Tax=Bullifex porci TaxID=2606638 RepID=UPI0023F58D55|nr:hypothetical protein [Bullifex porci]MDD7256608.1 hypothetical protein [Bullifex porci]MDY2742231.1 hypothetical protein [Bullifex porci]
MQAIFETLFDVVYLITVVTLGFIMIKRSEGNKQYLLFGIMAVTLGFGDAFHLVPRAVALYTTGLDNYIAPLGIGKLITSITMTIFYVLMYYAYRERYRVSGKSSLTIGVWALAIARIILCLFPQNGWTSADAPLAWGIYRNIPFTILGIIIVVLYYRASRNDKAFRWMYLSIIISFACYIPVVLFADSIPIIGMLMIPKTCAYVWSVLIAFNAQRRNK